ncbi:MAG: LysM peptidoglycan-binding domain-containing protein [Planctomycetota bacterium]
MSVTLPYKIALAGSLVALLLATGVRFFGENETAADPSALASEATEIRIESTPEAPMNEADGDRSPSVASAAHAPSKPPPSLPDAIDDPPGGSELGGAEPQVPDEATATPAPPTLTVGRLPGEPGRGTTAVLGAQPTDPGDEPGNASQAARSDASATYTVRRGDSFEAIARRELGSASRWVALAKANPTVDPLKLRVGDVLRLPPEELDTNTSLVVATSDAPPVTADAATLPPPPDPVTYVVRSGDSLSTIAARFYSDSSRWRAIFNANRDRLKDPHAVRIGMELRIPPAIAAAPGSAGN